MPTINVSAVDILAYSVPFDYPESITITYYDNYENTQTFTYPGLSLTGSVNLGIVVLFQLHLAFLLRQCQLLSSSNFSIDTSGSTMHSGYSLRLNYDVTQIEVELGAERCSGHSITLSYGMTSILLYFDRVCKAVYFAVTALCVAPFTKINGGVEIKDIKDHQILKTSRGELEVAQVLKTSTIGNTKYVKFSKNCFGENLPSDDLYITPDHPFNLGLFENIQENTLVYNPIDDDYVMLQIVAGEFIDELEGISVIEENFGHYYNLVFDIHTSLNMEGLDVCSHHPRTSPHILPEDSYVKIKPTKKDIIKAPKLINYAQLLSYKPENIDEKTFIGKCLNGCSENKFQLRL